MEQMKPEDLLIVKCQKNMPIANVNAMHKWLCNMKESGIVVLPKDVSLIVISKDVHVY